MSGETLTAEQVLQALAGLTDKVGDAFLAIEGLANKTTEVAEHKADPPPSSSSSKKTAKAPENFDGSIEGGHAFL